jgi:hypothetical protein
MKHHTDGSRRIKKQQIFSGNAAEQLLLADAKSLPGEFHAQD